MSSTTGLKNHPTPALNTSPHNHSHLQQPPLPHTCNSDQRKRLGLSEGLHWTLTGPTSVCQWINSFLTDRQQLVRLGKYTSSTRLISTGAPLSSTSDSTSVKLLKFADDTKLIGLIQDGDESAYRQEVKELAVWCSLNNLELNTLKTVEIIVDFRRNPPALPPLTIMNSTVTAVESFRFMGTTISHDLKWDNHIESIVKKAQQRLYFLRQLRKFNLPQELLKQFYSSIIEKQ